MSMIAPHIGLFETLFSAIVAFIVVTIFYIFSPFGLGFILFSFVRHFAKDSGLKKASFILQIIFTATGLLVGVALGIAFMVNISYYYNQSIFSAVAGILSLLLVVVLEILVMIWQKNK